MRLMCTRSRVSLFQKLYNFASKSKEITSFSLKKEDPTNEPMTRDFKI